VIYPEERARAAMQNFFKEPTLVALRELAMRQTAHAVETRQTGEEPPSAERAAQRQPRERLLLLIEPVPASAALIRRGHRVADYLQAECFAVCVSKAGDLSELSLEERETIDRQLNFARALQIETRILQGDDIARTLLNFARTNGVTQIFVMRQKNTRIPSLLRRGLVQRIVGLAPDMQVTIVADRSVRRDKTAGP
jgi:two-component system, OmpR family, sensor histidine kinase KdpD